MAVVVLVMPVARGVLGWAIQGLMPAGAVHRTYTVLAAPAGRTTVCREKMPRDMERVVVVHQGAVNRVVMRWQVLLGFFGSANRRLNGFSSGAS